jgi:hypothetical protein
VTRLIDIGVPGYQIATAVKGVVAQRLVRRVCPACSGVGCAACVLSGYRGRLAVAEILVGSPEFERRVAAGASTEAIAEAARAGGCVTLWDSGVELVRRGETTMDELRRVAAEPVRLVTEASPNGAGPRVRIGWGPSAGIDRHQALHAELTSAAALLGGQVDVVAVTPGEQSYGLVDALVVDAPVPGRRQPGLALIVALAHGASSSDHVRTLAQDADLVLSGDAHGRFLLATILALLRWRSR